VDVYGTLLAQIIGNYISMSIECEFLTGPAGTGKSFEVKRRLREDPQYGILCATTGIAAVNLETITLNSLLKYFDTNSLRDIYVTGKLVTRLVELSKFVRRIIIDEVSILSGDALDILYKAVEEANSRTTTKNKIGIILTGDFAQLPPIKEPWAFTAECWPEFERNTTRLEKNWRQSDEKFLDALNNIRRGDGLSGLRLLVDSGVKLQSSAKVGEPGTTILARNQDVDRFNFTSHQLVKSPRPDIVVSSYRWGQQRSEWNPAKGYIPLRNKFKEGSYVMILSNDSPNFTYVNGDCGYVRDYNPITDKFIIELIRTGKPVSIGTVDRYYTTREDPDLPVGFRPVHLYCECSASKSQSVDLSQPTPAAAKKHVLAPWGIPSFNCSQGSWNTGAVRYHPLRLAYAATVHKTQGLTLDRVQVDFRNYFFSSPAMMYVALSRCRTPEGLRLVGSEEQFIKRVNASEEVRRWL
jgi:ATP-dependent DNA helicase PIF1